MFKNEIVKKYVTVTLFLVVIIGTLIGASYLFAPIKEKSILKSKLKKYSKITSNITEVKEVEFTKGIITEKLKGLDKDGKEVATLYTAAKSNQYGNIEIIVAVNDNGEILGIDSTIMDQSIKPGETSAYLRSFKGSSVQKPEGNIAMPTVAVSIGTVEEILSEISNSQGIKISKLEEAFGQGATRSNKVQLEDEFVKSLEEVKLDNVLVGYIYTSGGNFGYNIRGEKDNPNEYGDIELELYLDLDLVVKGYDFTVYKHSKGYDKDAIKYLTLLIEGSKNINEAKDLYVPGDYTSGSYSAHAIYKLVFSINNYLKDGE